MVETERLNAAKVKSLLRKAQPGRVNDGQGLYLLIAKGGTGSWLFRYKLNGSKLRDMGLGSTHDVSLADAREKAAGCRDLLRDKLDPLAHKKQTHRANIAATDAAIRLTFQHCAEQYIAAFEPSWRNPKHRQQWKNTLATYVYPVIGDVPVADINLDHVMSIVQPLWGVKTETANRVRGRIEIVLNWAKTKGYRSGENPAMWRGNLSNLLPKRSAVAHTKHMPALPYADVPKFMARLAKRTGDGARCLELTILTAVRSASSRGALLAEFDLAKKVWVIPASRMKAVGGKPAKAFTVALSNKAVTLIKAQPQDREFLFEGDKPGQALSENTMLEVLERMGLKGETTVHGMRSSFKDWAADTTDHPDIVSEMALAHTIPDETQRAYRRGELLAKRFALANDWAKFCASAGK